MALESTLIQSFAGLSNTKFSELRIVKMKENCSIKNEDEEHTYEEAGAQNTLGVPASFICTQYGNSMKSRTNVFYMNTMRETKKLPNPVFPGYSSSGKQSGTYLRSSVFC